MTALKVEHADGLPVPQRYWAILTIALGLIMAVMDGAIANVALPTIARDLDASPAFSIWIVNGYQLAITISLLPLASLGEIIGYRRVYLAGVAALHRSHRCSARCRTRCRLLTVARIVQGFGAAGIMSVNTALVRFIYPRAQLGRGIGDQRHGGRRLRRGRPDGRSRHPGGRHLALAVRGQPPDRACCARAGHALSAACTARAAMPSTGRALS